MDTSNLQVRWKHHQMGVIDYLRQLLVSEVFVDVTLCCQNKRFKAHRILLSACSSYLQQVLVEHLESDHITIILPDIHHEDMQWLLDFMYTGSVAVPRCRLASFLQAAETLHIKVLTDMAQLQKATDSDIITCVPASSLSLDVILSDQQKFPKQILNSNLKSQDIKEDNLNEDVKITFCNTEAHTTTERTRLEQFKPNKSEFKSATEDRNSCMFKSSVNNSSCVPRCYQNYTESNSVTCNSTLNASSSCAGLTKRTEQRDANEEQKISGAQVCSSKGAAVRNSSCNTKTIHNTVEENNKSVGCSSENALVPYLDNPLLSKGCDNKDAVENLNNNQNAKPIPVNHNEKLLKPSQINRSCSNGRIGISREVSSPIEYGFQPDSANNLHINQKGNNVTAHSFNPAYRKDMRLSHELPSVSQHSSQLDNPEYYSQYLQRLSQWPKPLPSLMPISNNNYHFNGQIAAHNFTKDDRFNGVISNQQIKDPQPLERLVSLPEHLKSANDIISSVQSNYQNCNSVSTAQHLKENKCFKNAWFPSRDKFMHVNGQRPMADCRFSSKKLSQIVPRLSPIVPPSPWAQNHRPPCAAPVVCPPRTGSIELSYQHSKWMALKQATRQAQNFFSQGEVNQHTSLSTSSGLQHLADHGGPPSSAPVPTNVSPVRNPTRPPSPHSKQLKGPGNNVTGHDQAAWIRKRTSENMEAFCRLKERRLHDFYKEQMSMSSRTTGNDYQEKEEEAASDLSTKSSQSPLRSPHSNSARSSPSDYPKPATPSTVSLQQKVSSAEFCAPKLAACNDSLYKDANKEEESTKLSKNCDIDGSDVGILREVNCTLNEDKMSHNTDIKNCESEQNCDGQNYTTADDDVQILKEERLTVLIKNDSNNNNGVIDDSAQITPAVKSHGCEDCGKFFSRRQLLVQHRRIHTGERPYSCADCGRQFTQRGHWSTHQKLHEPARRPEHACPSCGKAFVTRASLKVHLRTHTGEKPFQCGECGKQFSQLRNYKYHRSVHEGTREFAATCPECGKYFNDRGYLSSHMKIHRNRKEYGCQYCGKSFNQRVAYNMHVRIHTGERPHSCPHCNKSFSRKMLLKQHLRIHTGEKPFACSVCGKAFADRSNMTLHMRLHSGIKPYSCQLCAKAFTKKHHLKTHLNYHTGTKPYSCSKCGLRFSQSSNMRTHYKKCTSTEPMKVERPVIKTEDTKQLLEEGNGVTSPSSSPGGSVTSPSSSAAAITPPHSDESSCGSSVIPRNPIEAQPA